MEAKGGGEGHRSVPDSKKGGEEREAAWAQGKHNALLFLLLRAAWHGFLFSLAFGGHGMLSPCGVYHNALHARCCLPILSTKEGAFFYPPFPPLNTDDDANWGSEGENVG